MIDKIMRNAMKTNWNITDDFDFRYSNTNQSYNFPGLQGLSAQDTLDICVINIDLPQMSGSLEGILQGGEYRLIAKKFEMFTFAVNFRDTLGLKLRDYFINIWMAQQTEYFDDIKSKIEVEVQNNVIFNSEDCMITSVSQSQLDNNNTQISEFTVEFQTPFYSNNNIIFGKYGQDGYDIDYNYTE